MRLIEYLNEYKNILIVQVTTTTPRQLLPSTPHMQPLHTQPAISHSRLRARPCLLAMVG